MKQYFLMPSTHNTTHTHFIYSLAQSVKLMIALAIFLTYALQFYVPMEIIWKNVRHKFSEGNKNAAEWTIRYTLVVSKNRVRAVCKI